MIYTIDDAISPRLAAIQLIAPNLAREQMSKAGHYVKEAMRSSMRRRGHSWHQRVNSKGKIHPVKARNFKQLGRRTTRKGTPSHTPPSMANFITSYFQEKSGTLVVGGGHAGFRPIMRKDGKITGVGSYVKGIGKHSQSILHKLDTGERTMTTKKGTYNHGWWSNGAVGEKSFIKGANFKGRGFMNEGIRRASGKVNSMITSEYDKSFGRAMNRATVNVKRGAA